MEVAIVNGLDQLLGMLEHVKAERVQAGVSLDAFAEIEILKKRIDAEPDVFPAAIDTLNLVYGSITGPALSLSERSALEVAVVLHEGMYNAFMRETFRVVKNLVEREDTDHEALRALLSRLIPDPVILQAMWNNVPTTTTLVHAAETQLGYLRRRSPALRELNALLTAKRPVLPIRNAAGFTGFLASISRLAELGEKAPELPEPKLSS